MARTYVITGASEGIGAELARQLARAQGSEANLVLAARSAEALEQVAAECRVHGAAVLARPTDVAVRQDCLALIAAAADRFGGIDVLVNNAGRSGHARFADVRPEDLGWYQTMMQVNLWGSVWCTHAALPWLQTSRGAIVAVSSPAGFAGVPGRSAYCASKFAMNGFFEALRIELRPAGVSVTLAFPALVATRIRQNGFDATGGPAGTSSLREQAAMPVEECASRILRGMQARQRTIFMTPRSRLVWLLKPWLPRLVDRWMSGLLKKPAGG